MTTHPSNASPATSQTTRGLLTLIIFFMVAVFAFGALKTEPVDTVLFRPVFEVGRVSVYDFQVESKSIYEQIGQDVFETISTTHLVMRVTVSSVNEDGNGQIEMTYDRVAMSQAGDSPFIVPYDFDSADPKMDISNPSVNRIVGLMKNLRLTAAISPDGDVTGLDGFQVLNQALQTSRELGGRQNEFSEQGLSDMIGSFYKIGKEAVDYTQGATWEEIESTDIGTGDLTFTTNYNVTEIAPEITKLGMNMVMSLKLKDESELPENTIPILEANMTTDHGDWEYEWDNERDELILRESRLAFTWMMKQEGLFGPAPEPEEEAATEPTADGEDADAPDDADAADDAADDQPAGENAEAEAVEEEEPFSFAITTIQKQDVRAVLKRVSTE